MPLTRLLLVAACFTAAAASADPVDRRTLNNGQLVLEDVPAIPADIIEALRPFQHVRAASFQAWSRDGEHAYVRTRFGDITQLHRVERPGGARHQLTFLPEPPGRTTRRPGSDLLLYARDRGGDEFNQLYLFDPATATETLLTDGKSLNGSAVWSRDGALLAYYSTLRTGAARDVWVMDPDDPGGARMVLEAPDGSAWVPVDFSRDGRRLLITQYVSATRSNVHLLDLATGALRQLAGDGASVNLGYGFGADDDGIWLVTDAGSEFRQLAWLPLAAGATPEVLTAEIPWDVSGLAASDDRRRGAFTVNADGRSALYLLDPQRQRYRMVDGLPTGQAYGLVFSPDGRRLGLTLNGPQSPSDAFVLDLGRQALRHGELTRWTASEVGGLDTDTFVVPELVHYPTFDTVDGEQRHIPAWVYKPPGKGPFPVVVSIHGGPEGQARPFFSSTFQIWVRSLGAAVVVPNVRGSAGYGKTYVNLDNGRLREDSVRDIGALLDWVATQPELDADRVAVTGGSYGGYMVLASAVHYSDRLAAAVDVVGISNFVTFLENTRADRQDLRRVEYGDERDPAMRAFLESISPLNQVERMRVPLFVVQGQNDPRVPVTEAEQVVAALRANGQDVWYMNALNEGHGYRRKENRDVYQQAVVLFLREHLAAD